MKPLPKKLREWSERPSPNPRYKGATPADVARALLGKKPIQVREAPEDYGDQSAKGDDA